MYKIEVNKAEYTITCDCPDSTYRVKWDYIDNKTPNVCKHARSVLRLARLLE
jgi:hypothetical protein